MILSINFIKKKSLKIKKSYQNIVYENFFLTWKFIANFLEKKISCRLSLKSKLFENFYTNKKSLKGKYIENVFFKKDISKFVSLKTKFTEHFL